MNRIGCYRQALRQSDADAFLLTAAPTRSHITATSCLEGMVFLTETDCRFFTDSRYLEAAQRELDGFPVLPVDREHGYLSRIAEAAAENRIERIGYEDGYLTAGELDLFREKLSVELIPVQSILRPLRQSKDPPELEHLRRAQEITDKAYAELLPEIRVGMTERELQAELIYRLYRCGGEGLSFDPIVVSGPNTSMPHGVAGSRKLAPGDFITMDFGCVVSGYCSDMTRTVALGFVTDEMKTVYKTVLAAQLAGIAATKAGVTGQQADEAARGVIREAGYGEYFGHSYGHGVGLEIHETPNCAPSWTSPLPTGAVCSAEPGIYLPGKFGVRIEDVVIVREDGCEILTKSGKTLTIL